MRQKGVQVPSFSVKLRHLRLQGQSNTELAITNNTDTVVIAVHGWQDNSNSFLPLMSALGKDLPVYAIDWPGHGLSQWRGQDAHYYFIDYVDDLHQLVMRCKAKYVHIIGHSLGAMVASLYCACFPERITSLSLIEGVGLVTAEEPETKNVLIQALKHRARAKKGAIYESAEQLYERREAVSDFNIDIARQLMARNIVKKERGVMLTTDPRLKHYSAFRYTKAQAHALLTPIKVPTLLIKGAQGYSMVHQNEQEFGKCYNDLVTHTVDGGHHCHMQSPKQCARLIGAHLHQNSAE
ncbi:alpha/beta hydrolase [Pseudoalteromonas ruthenica]|nr:alpha/beta hydrolase [Pseudoalteromonas ruthenica]TMO52597.1 alpha/beta hydrolase [Pseudoalteromonas ruthenica]